MMSILTYCHLKIFSKLPISLKNQYYSNLQQNDPNKIFLLHNYHLIS